MGQDTEGKGEVDQVAERIRLMQDFYSQQAAYQKQALQKKCPQCKGKLIQADIMSVRCEACKVIYNAEKIAKDAP